MHPLLRAADADSIVLSGSRLRVSERLRYVKKSFNYLFFVNTPIIIIIIIIIISQTGMFINTEICCRLVPVTGNVSYSKLLSIGSGFAQSDLKARPKRETNHFPPFDTEVRNGWILSLRNDVPSECDLW